MQDSPQLDQNKQMDESFSTHLDPPSIGSVDDSDDDSEEEDSSHSAHNTTVGMPDQKSKHHQGTEDDVSSSEQSSSVGIFEDDDDDGSLRPMKEKKSRLSVLSSHTQMFLFAKRDSKTVATETTDSASSDKPAKMALASYFQKTTASTNASRRRLSFAAAEHDFRLPKDTYSLLAFSSHPVSLTISVLVALFQYFVLVLLLVDIIDIHSTTDSDDPDDYHPNNPVGIPAGVTTPVAIAQCLAMLLIFVGVRALVWAINVYIQGYSEITIQRILRQGVGRGLNNERQRTSGQLAGNDSVLDNELLDETDHVTMTRHEDDDEDEADLEEMAGLTGNDQQSLLKRAKQYNDNNNDQEDMDPEDQGRINESMIPFLKLRWYFANGLRLLEGCLSYVGLFLLIVRSETVLSVLLAFVTIYEISSLDQIVFWLAKWGYFGLAAKDDANHDICNSAHFSFLPAWSGRRVGSRNHQHTNKWTNTNFVRSIVLSLVLVLIALISWSVVFAKQKRGEYIADEIYVQMGDVTNLSLGTYSGIYVRSNRRNRDTRRFRYTSRDGHRRGEFTYCSSIHAWIFRDRDHFKEGNDCGWWIKSEETQSFDLLNSEDDESFHWFTKSEFNINTPIEWMHLSAYNSRFKKNGKCPMDGSYGLNCEFQSPYPRLSEDMTADPFGHGARGMPKEFNIMENAEIYHRPVYYGQAQSDSSLYVMLFLGRRWVIASTKEWGSTDITSPDQLEDIAISNELHVGLLTNQTGAIQYISDPVDVTAPNNQATPVGLRWYRSIPPTGQQFADGMPLNADLSSDTNTRLVCASCSASDDGGCMFNGICQDDSCVCEQGSQGSLCEVPPTRNGFCNSNFNNPSFDFDGG